MTRTTARATTRTTTRTTTISTTPESRPATAAVLAIGNELLSGKIRDENLHYLAGELRALGVSLRLAMFVPDEEDAIALAIHQALERADVVLTTGGVGPTHDDVTLAGVARAFERELEPDPGLVAAIHTYYQARVNDELLGMANVPQGAELIQPAPFFLPIFRVGRVYVFPGDPLALKRLFEPWKEALRGEPYHLARLELDADEGELAPLLRETEQAAGLSVGSYPRYDEHAPYRVLVTLEGKAREQVVATAAALARRIEDEFGREALLRVESPQPGGAAQPATQDE